MTRPLLLGHRGARAVKSVPENTIASFDRALADGCDGFEFDVRLTADGQPVVCHDPNVGDFEINHTAAPRLPALPRLHEVVERYRSAFLDVELKVPGLEKFVIEALRARQSRRFVVSSFLPEVLEALHAADPTVPLGLICETKAQFLRWNHLPVEYVVVQRKLAARKLLRDLPAAGRKVLVWTVNASVEMKQFAAWGVDGIISDNPKLLSATLR